MKKLAVGLLVCLVAIGAWGQQRVTLWESGQHVAKSSATIIPKHIAICDFSESIERIFGHVLRFGIRINSVDFIFQRTSRIKQTRALRVLVNPVKILVFVGIRERLRASINSDIGSGSLPKVLERNCCSVQALPSPLRVRLSYLFNAHIGPQLALGGVAGDINRLISGHGRPPRLDGRPARVDKRGPDQRKANQRQHNASKREPYQVPRRLSHTLLGFKIVLGVLLCLPLTLIGGWGLYQVAFAERCPRRVFGGVAVLSMFPAVITVLGWVGPGDPRAFWCLMGAC